MNTDPSQKLLHYDLETGEIINDEIEESFRTRIPLNKRVGIVTKGAYVHNNRVFFKENGKLVTKEEVERKMEGKEISEPQKSFNSYAKDNNDYFIRLTNEHAKESNSRNNAGVNTDTQNKFKQASQKSVTGESRKRKKDRFVFRAKDFIITFTVIATLMATPQIVHQIKDTQIVNSESSVYAQIYNEKNDANVSTISFVNTYKYTTGGYDENGQPAWDYNYNGIVKNFLSYDDKYFVSNFKKLYDDLGRTRDWKYYGNLSIMDYITQLISEQVANDPDKYPTAFRYLEGVNNFDDFLKKNYAIYTTKEDADLEKVYLDTVHDQIVLEAPQMVSEYTIPEEKEIGELMTETESEGRGR